MIDIVRPPDQRRFEVQLVSAEEMQLKRRGHPVKAAVAFLNGLVHLTERGFELQLVRLGIPPKTRKRGAFLRVMMDLLLSVRA